MYKNLTVGTQILLHLIWKTALLFQSTVCMADSASMSIRLKVNKNELVQQGPNECVPASLFNSFLMGSEQLRSAIMSLPGDSIIEKYRYAIKNIALKPSEFCRGSRSRLSPTWGMHVSDGRAFARDLLGGLNIFRIEFPKRQASDSARAFAIRVHDQILASLKSGVPPVVVIKNELDGMQVDFGHMVSVSGVGPVNGKGFDLYIEDPQFNEARKIHFEVLGTTLSTIQFISAVSTAGNAEPISSKIQQKITLSFVMGNLPFSINPNPGEENLGTTIESCYDQRPTNSSLIEDGQYRADGSADR